MPFQFLTNRIEVCRTCQYTWSSLLTMLLSKAAASCARCLASLICFIKGSYYKRQYLKYKTWTPGPWTPCLDRVHGPLYGPGPWTPSMGCIVPNFNITVKHDSSFQFLKIF
jgi:hypothetical protein